MSCSSNESPAPTRGLRPRLAAALAASAALHALLAAGLGVPRGEASLYREAQPLHAQLRAPDAAASAPGKSPAGAGSRRTVGDGPLALPPRYYATRELDVLPGIKTRVHPEYPEAAARRFLGGKVRLHLFIDESGAVERVQTLHADFPQYFEEPARQAFRAARYSPGIKDGRAVKVRMAIEVTFDSPSPPAPPGRR